MRRTARRSTGLLSMGTDAPDYFPRGEIPLPVKDKDGNFDLDGAKRFIQWGLRRSVDEYAVEQSEELLAENMRELVAAMVTVSPRDVWDAYVREKETARVRYIRFRPQYYRETLEVTDAALTAWMGEHADELDERYQAEKHRYTGLEKQVRARHILIKTSESDDEVKRQQAREKIDAILAQARAPGADFAALAREYSEDTATARRGGDRGFSPRGRNAAAFEDVLFSLDEGQISDVIETQFGFDIIKVEKIREGDVPEEEAKRELAEGMYRASQSEERARAAADAILQRLREGTDMDTIAAELSGRPVGVEESEEPELLPEPDPLSPQVEETRSFGRGDSPVSGLTSGAFVQAAFDLSEESPLSESVLKVGSDFFILRLEERNRATEEGFDEATQLRLNNGLKRAREREAIELLIARLRKEADSSGAVRINNAVLIDEEDEG
jgi:peptidyl-prolyl cis-trans isomerase D